MGACVFCDVIAGRAPASVVYEDDQVLAFLDIHPVNPGHVLVIPKGHFARLEDVPMPITAHLFTVSQRLAGAIRRSGVRCEGINLSLADGTAAGQDVFHCHVHVRPRYTGDSYRVTYDASVQPTRSELDAVARAIGAAYRAAFPTTIEPQRSQGATSAGPAPAGDALAVSSHVATVADLATLAEMNRQLIQDEGHRNPMTLAELAGRMRQWLERGEYSAILFEQDAAPVGYALYRDDPDVIYLRQFFIARGHRRCGLGRQAMSVLLSQHWPPGKRVTVSVLVSNLIGLAFWRAVGFHDYALTLEMERLP